MTTLRSARAATACILVALVGTSAIEVRAEPAPQAADAGAGLASPASIDLAREAFKQGTALARNSQWSDALAAFERSAELHPHAVTTYNLAFCERGLGHLTRARQLFQKALHREEWSGGTDLPPHYVAQADGYIAEIDKTVARVSVTLFPPDAALSVDGSSLERLPSEPGGAVFAVGTRAASPEVVGTATFELWLDPGPHRFVVTSPGHRDTVVERSVAAGEKSKLELRAVSAPVDLSVGAEPASGSSRVPMYTALAVGGLGLAVGITAGIVAIDKKSRLGDLCREKTCYPGEGNAALDATRTAADISTIGFAVGAAGGITGALFWLFGSTKSESKASSGLSGWVPYLGPTSFELEKRF